MSIVICCSPRSKLCFISSVTAFVDEQALWKRELVEKATRYLTTITGRPAADIETLLTKVMIGEI